jgi:hypothetical protein
LKYFQQQQQKTSFRHKRDGGAVVWELQPAEGSGAAKLAEFVTSLLPIGADGVKLAKLADQLRSVPVDIFANALEKFRDGPDYEQRLSPAAKALLIDQATSFFRLYFC